MCVFSKLFGSTQLYSMSLYIVSSSMTCWHAKVGVEELDLNPMEDLWDELECQMYPKPPHTSLCDLTNALVDEWTQIPTITLQK